PGDQVKFTLRAVLQGEGFTETETAEGNGEELTFAQDSILVNELGHTVKTKSDNTIDAQRVPFNLREEARDGLGEWYANRKGVSIFNQLCGFTPANTVGPNGGTKFTGLNPVTAPTSGAGLTRQIWPGVIANDQGLSTNDI